MRRLRLVFLGLVLGATVLASGAVGTARAGLTCPGQNYVQPFEPWLDEAFATYERNPQPITHEVGVDAVDRIRFVAHSWHNVGAGLAELSFEG